MLAKQSKKAKEFRTSQVAAKILMCIFSLGLYFNNRQHKFDLCFTFGAVCLS